MSFLRNMAVNLQLNLITLFALIGFIIVGAVYYTNINVQKGFQQSQLRDIEGVSYVNAIKVGFLQERRNEKDFLLRKDMKYVERHASVAKDVLAQFENLKSIHSESGYAEKINVMRDNFSAYTDQFVKVADNWQVIGLSPKEGLRGKLRAAVHAVEHKLKKLDKPRLAVIMLMMRRHEKDFFMRLDEKYVKRQDVRLSEFHEELAKANDISAGDKGELKAMLDIYLSDFKEVSALMLQDQINRKKMSALYAVVKPQLDQLNEEGNASAQAATAALQDNITSTFIRITTAMVLIALIVATFSSVIARGIVKPIKLLTKAMARLAKGDLEIRIPAQRYTNEIGEMSSALSVFKENAIQVVEMREERKKERDRNAQEQRSILNKMASSFERNVGGVIKSVGQAATELQASASQMSSTASETNTQSKTVASAAKEASNNVQTVAVVAEELSASVNEISNHAQKSNDIANTAASQADETKKSVEAMVGEVSKIGAVVSLISDIAEQTNLLALNATIEAARAGSAGKGFAIVASEVKNLASQTAQATEEISSQVGKLQTVTDSTASEIDEIGRIIYEIDEISTAISVAVEEQSSATAEIARSVHHAAKGSESVSLNIQSVEHATDETGSAATQISTSATELSSQSNTLRDEVSKFLDQVRSDNQELALGT